MDQSRMAQRDSVLSCLPSLRAGGPEILVLFDVEYDLPPPPLRLLSGEPEFQGLRDHVLFCDLSGDGLVWAADDPFWLRVSADTADLASALPPARRCTIVVDSAAVLSLGQYSRLVVYR